jgi:MFS family permease
VGETIHRRGSRRDARTLAVGRLISIAGSTAAGIALSSVLWQRTHDAAWVAAGALGSSLVTGLVTPLVGPYADRFDRRRLMVASDVAAACAFGVLAGLVAMRTAPAVIVMMGAIAAVCETPFIPASRAALPNLVDDEDLGWANGLLGQVMGLSFTIGPVLGGTVTAVAGAPAALALNAISFAASAILVGRIRGRFRREGDAVRGREKGAVRAGFRFVAADRLLRATVFSGFVAFIGVGFMIATNPAFADHNGAGALGLGVLWTGWGVGSILGARLAGRLVLPGREVRTAVIGFALQATAILLAAALPFWVAAAALALGGVGSGIADPARQTLVMRRSPDEIRGRVFATMEAVGWSSFAISLVAAGVLVTRLGDRPSYLVAGLLFLVGTVQMVAMAGRGALRSGVGT